MKTMMRMQKRNMTTAAHPGATIHSRSMGGCSGNPMFPKYPGVVVISNEKGEDVNFW